MPDLAHDFQKISEIAEIHFLNFKNQLIRLLNGAPGPLHDEHRPRREVEGHAQDEEDVRVPALEDHAELLGDLETHGAGGDGGSAKVKSLRWMKMEEMSKYQVYDCGGLVLGCIKQFL